MREKNIEKQLRIEVKKRGGIAIKFTSPGFAGVPDRMVLMPKSNVAFVELKAPGKQLKQHQAKRKRQLEELGFSVYIIDNIDKIGGVLDEICAT
jgi:hypothetical protein